MSKLFYGLKFLQILTLPVQIQELVTKNRQERSWDKVIIQKKI
jgi:hypothetical protein